MCHPTAIHRETLSRDPARLLREQERHHRCDVFRHAKTERISLCHIFRQEIRPRGQLIVLKAGMLPFRGDIVIKDVKVKN